MTTHDAHGQGGTVGNVGPRQQVDRMALSTCCSQPYSAFPKYLVNSHGREKLISSVVLGNLIHFYSRSGYARHMANLRGALTSPEFYHFMRTLRDCIGSLPI